MQRVGPGRRRSRDDILGLRCACSIEWVVVTGTATVTVAPGCHTRDRHIVVVPCATTAPPSVRTGWLYAEARITHDSEQYRNFSS